MGSAAACSNVRLAGLGATLFSAAHANSAKAPRTNPNTSSPGCSPCTSAPTVSTTPAASVPTTGIFGLVSPIPMSRATFGSPRTMCQSAGLRAAAWTRTSTSSAPTSGRSVSTSRSVSGGPNRSWTMAFMGCLLRRIVRARGTAPVASSMSLEQPGWIAAADRRGRRSSGRYLDIQLGPSPHRGSASRSTGPRRSRDPCRRPAAGQRRRRALLRRSDARCRGRAHPCRRSRRGRPRTTCS